MPSQPLSSSVRARSLRFGLEPGAGIDGWLYFYDYFDARQSTQKIDSWPDPVTCPICGLTYCSDLERERASHRTFHHKHLHVHHPQPEPRLAGFGEGDIRVDASSPYLLNQLVYERAQALKREESYDSTQWPLPESHVFSGAAGLRMIRTGMPGSWSNPLLFRSGQSLLTGWIGKTSVTGGTCAVPGSHPN